MISVTILSKDNEETIENILEATQKFDEIILLDTGSSDNTLSIAKKFPNVKIFQKSFSNFGILKNQAAQMAKNTWILSLDSDEILSPALIEEILSTSLNEKCLYSFVFHNFLNGKFIKYCGWYPDRHIRLYNKKYTAFSSDHLHEKIEKKNLSTVYLTHPIYHFSYRKTDHFLTKMQKYSSFFALQHQGKKKSSFFHALYHGFFAFIKTYFIKRGFLSGKEGFIIAIYNANTSFYKYLKLAEINNKKK